MFIDHLSEIYKYIYYSSWRWCTFRHIMVQSLQPLSLSMYIYILPLLLLLLLYNHASIIKRQTKIFILTWRKQKKKEVEKREEGRKRGTISEKSANCCRRFNLTMLTTILPCCQTQLFVHLRCERCERSKMRVKKKLIFELHYTRLHRYHSQSFTRYVI